MELGPHIAVTSRNPGNLDLFTVGMDGAVYTTWWYAGADWAAVSHNWKRIGGIFPPGAPITAIAKSPDSIDLFVIGGDGRVYTSWWYGGQEWSGINDNWKSLGGFFKPGNRVAATTRNPANIDLFALGRDGRVYTSWWYGGQEWSGINDNWKRIGGIFPSDAPITAIAKSPDSIDVFVLGSDGRVYTSWWYGGQEWSGINDNWRVLAPDEHTFTGQVLTPAGTALGGNASITIRRDGTWTATFHMHDSGAIGYDFSVTATLVSPDGLTLLARHSGHVGGTVSSGARDDDHHEDGFHPLIAAQWDSLQHARLWVTKDYSATGVAGVVEDVTKAVLDVAAGTAGGALGVVIALSAEAGQLLGDLGLGGTFGVIAGVVVFAFGGSVVLAIEAGVAVGAMTNALIKQRPLAADEIAFANKHVFAGTLPGGMVRLTNLAGLGGRAFTMPGSDGLIYVNIGSDAFDSPLTYQGTTGYHRAGRAAHPRAHARLADLARLVRSWAGVRRNCQPGEQSGRPERVPVPGARAGLVDVQPGAAGGHRRSMVRRDSHRGRIQPDTGERPGSLLPLHPHQHPRRQDGDGRRNQPLP